MMRPEEGEIAGHGGGRLWLVPGWLGREEDEDFEEDEQEFDREEDEEDFEDEDFEEEEEDEEE